MRILLNLNSARFRERGRNTKMLCKIDTNSRVKKETVNHPSHYQSLNGLEVIDVMKSFTEDLKKAEWYLNHLIDFVKEQEDLQ